MRSQAVFPQDPGDFRLRDVQSLERGTRLVLLVVRIPVVVLSRSTLWECDVLVLEARK